MYMIVTTSGKLPLVLPLFIIFLNQFPFAAPLPYNLLVCIILTLLPQTKHDYSASRHKLAPPPALPLALPLFFYCFDGLPPSCFKLLTSWEALRVQEISRSCESSLLFVGNIHQFHNRRQVHTFVHKAVNTPLKYVGFHGVDSCRGERRMQETVYV
jgi:hypothetical protein